MRLTLRKEFTGNLAGSGDSKNSGCPPPPDLLDRACLEFQNAPGWRFWRASESTPFGVRGAAEQWRHSRELPHDGAPAIILSTMGDMSHLGGNDPPDLEQLRARLAKMSDKELRRFGEAALLMLREA